MGLEWRGEQIENALGQDAIDFALLQGMEHILAESNKIVPHEFGELERTGEAQVQNGRGTVSYESIYAVPQHERMDYKHSPGRKAKFLEIAATENADEVAQIVAYVLKQGLGG